MVLAYLLFICTLNGLMNVLDVIGGKYNSRIYAHRYIKRRRENNALSYYHRPRVSR